VSTAFFLLSSSDKARAMSLQLFLLAKEGNPWKPHFVRLQAKIVAPFFPLPPFGNGPFGVRLSFVETVRPFFPLPPCLSRSFRCSSLLGHRTYSSLFSFSASRLRFFTRDQIDIGAPFFPFPRVMKESPSSPPPPMKRGRRVLSLDRALFPAFVCRPGCVLSLSIPS